MPHILIAYDTTEGQTRKIAQRMADAVARAGHEVELHGGKDADTSKNHVYTDWDAVDRFVVDFLDRCVESPH